MKSVRVWMVKKSANVTIVYGTNDNYSIETKTIVPKHAHTNSSEHARVSGDDDGGGDGDNSSDYVPSGHIPCHFTSIA